jgi:hypothetical protein
VLAPPGKYPVRQTVDGRQHTEAFEVVKDRAIPSHESELVASTEAQERIVADINEAVDLINRLEVIGKQIEDQLRTGQANQPLVKELPDALEGRRMDVLRAAPRAPSCTAMTKWYVESYRIYLNLLWLSR